jgi:hypothetical protein
LNDQCPEGGTHVRLVAEVVVLEGKPERPGESDGLTVLVSDAGIPKSDVEED